MPTHRRWLPVLSTMTVAMALSAATLQQFSDGLGPRPFPWLPRLSPFAACHGIGLVFAFYAASALRLTRRWHDASVASGKIPGAIIRISLTFPALYWGGILVVSVIIKEAPYPRIEAQFEPLMYGAMVGTSALGARSVAGVLANLTGRVDRPLRRAMVVWGACWPLVHPLADRLQSGRGVSWLWFDLFAPGKVLAWQLPIGLACAAWFVRAGAGRPPPRYALRRDLSASPPAPARLAR